MSKWIQNDASSKVDVPYRESRCISRSIHGALSPDGQIKINQSSGQNILVVKFFHMDRLIPDLDLNSARTGFANDLYGFERVVRGDLAVDNVTDADIPV